MEREGREWGAGRLGARRAGREEGWEGGRRTGREEGREGGGLGGRKAGRLGGRRVGSAATLSEPFQGNLR